MVPLCNRCHQSGRDAAHARGKGWGHRHQIDLEQLRLGLYRDYATARGLVLPDDLDAETTALWLLGHGEE